MGAKRGGVVIALLLGAALACGDDDGQGPEPSHRGRAWR